MRSGRQRSWRRGFTLVETLAAAAIVIILLGVSAVGVVYYSRWLKITELDNAAREIYLAAENRAVLLSGSGRLEKLVSSSGQDVTVTLESGSDSTAPGYYIHHTGGSEVANLLPLGTIDPALMNGTFYIVYEPKGGSVTDVFYAESEPNADGVDFQTFYQDVSTLPRSARMQMKPMVGYYGGGTAEDARDGALGVPIVTIKNEETLTAEITYTVLPSVASNVTLKAELAYNGRTVDISPDPASLSRTETYGRVRFSCTITLDSLDSLDSLDGQHFSAWFPSAPDSLSFGGDFTVTATLTAVGSAASSSGSGKGNSLFAEGSSGETAYIANLRHLQNLDKNTSRVAGKTEAVQKNHIDCASHPFTPIQNTELTSYDGGSFALRGLHTNGTGSAGLFGRVSGISLQNIRMVNASVEGTDCAGAIVGYAKNASFENCWVYWEPETSGASLRGALGSSEDGYKYQITGANAGGLAGELNGGSIKNCLAATLVKGTAAAGGLIGRAAGTVKIDDSYADCYLTGKTVGGLAGTAGNLELTNCFAAGFIDIPVSPVALDPDGEAAEPPVSAAGLCASGTVAGNSVYSAMRYSGTDTEGWLPLAPDLSSWTNYYYLSLNIGSEIEGHDRTYTQMTGSGFAGDLGGAFAPKLPGDSHPYNLRTGLALTAYDFPGLADLPHYGDWSAQFVPASLVYYEQYSEDAYGFYGGGVDALQDTQPVKDGYAIAISEEDSLTVAIGDENYTYTAAGGDDARKLYAVTGADGTGYRLAPLPDELVNVVTAPKDFYQLLSFTINSETPDETDKAHDYYYCPHFAKTALKTDELPSAPPVVYVRTPRHLYMLSKHPVYYNGGYRFYQELELDYAVYTGYDLFPEDFTQASIGSSDAPFNGFYDGGCHAIRGLSFQPLIDTTPVYAGLFGYSSGTLRNIVYFMDAGQNAASLDNHNILYFGSLAGGNAGSIVNCAAAGVSLAGSAYTGATVYLGGLVGLNQGEISNCAAECAALSAVTSNYAHAYVGGLVGQNRNSGLISASYAVGRASAAADDTSDARVCGFVGYNQGLIQYSYAAMDLTSSGTAVETYGFCGVTEGTQNGTFFLNKGNFTYRDVPYNASYVPREAAEIEYARLTDRTATPVTGMSFVDLGGFPYPTGVKTAAGRSVHYGLWPEPMDLGIMGVYYWEELKIKGEEASTHHVSLLAVDSGAKIITKQTTLSAAHSDNGVVTDYGYGYYYADKATGVTLTAADISYSTSGGVGSGFTVNESNEAKDANNALAALMPGYTFHSYHSYGMEDDGGGLYPSSEYTDPTHTSKAMKTSGTNGLEIKIKDYTRKPNGTFTLEQGSLEVVFTLNPHFADALSVALPDGWTPAGGASTAAPGSTAGNPYQVRALSQLQNINWCVRQDTGDPSGSKVSADQTTVNILSNSMVVYNNGNGSFGGNQYGFLYLSHDTRWGTNDTNVNEHQGVSRGDYNFSWSELYEYHWVQTHDIDGRNNSFTPIAAFSDRTTNPEGGAAQEKGDTILTAWFGGSYDGGDYTIKNINIAAAEANCVGLFGVTLDATLKNIILYSESGENTVTVSGRTAYNDLYSWYAAGGLVGLAGVSTQNKDAAKTISNCSVAGYTIVDGTQYGNPREYGGGAVGGLVGVCNLDLSNCTASTTIEMSYTRKNGSNAASPVRVGGLAGTCVASITNCYATGEIKNSASTGNVYVGGLVGGAGMRRIYVPYFIASASGGGVGIKDSYSTVRLPGKTESAAENMGHIRESCAIGGPGGSTAYTVSITNCYALQEDTENTENNENTDTGVTKVSYAQLAGDDPIVSKNDGTSGEKNIYIYDLLPAFSPVTAQTEDGFSVSGKYSYASAPSLQGLNYPFPTILTRENGQYHVHYGDWPLNGIKRKAGNAPLELDLFTDPDHPETLDLFTDPDHAEEVDISVEGISTGGTWGVEAAPVDTTGENGETVTKEIVTATITDGKLTVTGTGVGVTTLTVTYTVDGVTYTLPLSVNVTAVLELRPEDNPVQLFTNDEVGVQLIAYGKNGRKLKDLGGPEITAASVEVYDHAHLISPKVDNDLTLKLSTRNAGDTTVSISYTYTYDDVDYTGMSAITFQVAEPEIQRDEDGTRRIVFKDGTVTDAEVEEGNLGEGDNKLTYTGSTVTLDMTDVPTGTDVTVKVTLTMNGRQHVVTVKIPVEEQGQMG